MKSVILVIAGAFSTAIAFAQGAGHVGGGGGVRCTNEAGNPSIVTLDYYQASLPPISGKAAPLMNMSGSEEEIIELFADTLDQAKVTQRNSPKLSLKAGFYEYLYKVGKIEDWTAADLSEYQDQERAFILPKNCVYVQIAIRQNDRIYGDPNVIIALSPAQRALIRIHEALYWYYKNTVEDQSSMHTRDVIDAVLKIATQFKSPYIKEMQYRLQLTSNRAYGTIMSASDELRANINALGGINAFKATYEKTFPRGTQLNSPEVQSAIQQFKKDQAQAIHQTSQIISSDKTPGMVYLAIIEQAALFKKGSRCKMTPDNQSPYCLQSFIEMYQGPESKIILKKTDDRGMISVFYEETIEPLISFKTYMNEIEKADIEKAIQGIQF